MPIQVGDLKLYDVEELSEMLHVQDRTIRKLLKEGQLKARKLARKWYVSEDSLKEYLNQAEQAVQQPEPHIPGDLTKPESMDLAGPSACLAPSRRKTN
jgi:excisionase family DNA binding protein